MRHFLTRSGAVVALLCGLAGAGPALAGVVNVTYSLTGSISSSLPIVPVGSGTMTVQYTSPSFSMLTIVPGPVHVLTFAFGGPINIPGLASGTLHLTGGSLAGSLNTLSVLGFGGGPLHVPPGGFIHCLNATCAAVFGLPATFPIPLASNNIGPIAVTGALSGLNPANFASLGGGLGSFNGLPLFIHLNGQEVGRTHVPEPTSLLLLGSGLAGMLALGGLRRLRR